ncbi:hypothetical protein KIN20_007060 [Parelaphostrongylus tenuis]|uniref:Uncharacterized protein n=1 Tax=Parelaphostrongylus tenuis TaxID=148309 RepID=A0AAD5MP14_PARTN|nr:hypothetical protein KIN20_007060 [Parelaphostrongylus tenuis]
MTRLASCHGLAERILRREAAKKAKLEAEELAKNPVPHLPKECKEPKKPTTKPSAKGPLLVANDVKEAVVPKPPSSIPDKKSSTESITSSVTNRTVPPTTKEGRLSIVDVMKPNKKAEFEEKVEKEVVVPKKKIGDPSAQRVEKKKGTVTSRVAALSSRFSVADSNVNTFLDMSSGRSLTTRNVDHPKKPLALPKKDKIESDKPLVAKANQQSSEVAESPKGLVLKNETTRQTTVANGHESDMKNLTTNNKVNVPKRSLSKEQRVRKPAVEVEKTDAAKVEKTSAAKTTVKQKKAVRKDEKIELSEKRPLSNMSEEKAVINKSESDEQQRTIRNKSEEVKKSLPIEKKVKKSTSVATSKKSKDTVEPKKLITDIPKQSNGVLPGKQAIGTMATKSVIKGVVSKFEASGDLTSEKKNKIETIKKRNDNLPRAIPEREKSPELIGEKAPSVEPSLKMTKRKRNPEKNAATGKRAMIKDNIRLNGTG